MGGGDHQLPTRSRRGFEESWSLLSGASSAALPSFTPQPLGITEVICVVTEEAWPAPVVTAPKPIPPVHKKAVTANNKKPIK
jgi:hypothetical protein